VRLIPCRLPLCCKTTHYTVQWGVIYCDFFPEALQTRTPHLLIDACFLSRYHCSAQIRYESCKHSLSGRRDPYNTFARPLKTSLRAVGSIIGDKLTSRERHILTRSARKDRRQTLGTSSADHRIHKQTARRLLPEKGIQKRRPTKKPFLTEAHRKNRRLFCTVKHTGLAIQRMGTSDMVG